MFLAFVLGNANAQEERKSYINPGLLTATSTLAPAIMLNRKEVNYYIAGFMEGRIDKHLSVRGEMNYMLPNANDKFLKNNLRTFFGIQYGFPIGNLDLHLGIMPGMSIMQSNRALVTNTEVVPSISLNAGLKFYVYKFFNFFTNFSYIHSSMNNLVQVNGIADEFMVSAGLGFNFQVLKKYR